MKAIKTSLLLVSLVSAGAFAKGKAGKIPACESVVKACEAAGFQPGDHKKTGKGLWVDCVHALAEGKSVSGVTVAQADAKACSDAAKAARAAKKK